jgi:hypothetical protein
MRRCVLNGGRFEGAEGELTGTGTVNLHTVTIEAELTATINKHPMPLEGNR